MFAFSFEVRPIARRARALTCLGDEFSKFYDIQSQVRQREIEICLYRVKNHMYLALLDPIRSFECRLSVIDNTFRYRITVCLSCRVY